MPDSRPGRVNVVAKSADARGDRSGSDGALSIRVDRWGVNRLEHPSHLVPTYSADDVA